tara:strand:- start:171 stop:362 length:192 start_codon:yes stop_codon:yes gene_type:complete
MSNWHSETIERFKVLPIESLKYIKSDAYDAATMGETIGNPKTGQYWDEFYYAAMELYRRTKQC